MKQIWFDLSDLYDWHGNFTGIQRVVYNLAKNFDEHGDARFFVYRHGVFSETTVRQLEARLGELNQATNGERLVPKNAKVSLKKIHHGGMVVLKDTVRGTGLEPGARKVYGAARGLYRRTKGAHLPRAHNYNLFGEQDVVLVTGGNWHLHGYAESLLKARAERGFKLIHVVNDIIALRNPAFVNAGGERIIGNYFKQIIDQADTLVAISESTKRDVEWYADTRLGKPKSALDVRIIRLGDDVSVGEITPQAPDKKITKDFILSVGTIEIRKNYRLLYNVYKLAEQQSVELPQLVIVGRKGWMADETYALLTRDSGLSDKVTVIEGPSDEELEWLYENCAFTIFPSMYEGWGLPIAESLQHGKCCVSTNVSAMPEVGGDLVTYVSPYDPAELLSAIQKLSRSGYRQKQEEKIASSYRPHTWEQTYKQLREIVDS